jgi:hypothetical protein
MHYSCERGSGVYAPSRPIHTAYSAEPTGRLYRTVHRQHTYAIQHQDQNSYDSVQQRTGFALADWLPDHISHHLTLGQNQNTQHDLDRLPASLHLADALAKPTISLHVSADMHSATLSNTDPSPPHA